MERLVVGRHLGERLRALDGRLGGRGVEAALVDIEGVDPCGVSGEVSGFGPGSGAVGAGTATGGSSYSVFVQTKREL